MRKEFLSHLSFLGGALLYSTVIFVWCLGLTYILARWCSWLR